MNGTDNTEMAGGALVGAPGRPARPVRFTDPARNAAYWARVDAIVSRAPALTDHQRAVIRSAFHQPSTKEAAA